MAPRAKTVKAEKSSKVEEKASPVRVTRKAATSPAKVAARKASPSPAPKSAVKKGKMKTIFCKSFIYFFSCFQEDFHCCCC